MIAIKLCSNHGCACSGVIVAKMLEVSDCRLANRVSAMVSDRVTASSLSRNSMLSRVNNRWCSVLHVRFSSRAAICLCSSSTRRRMFTRFVAMRADFTALDCAETSLPVKISSMRKVWLNGEERALVDVAREAGLPPRVLSYRLSKGLPIQDALGKPPRDYPRGVKRSRSRPSNPPPREPEPLSQPQRRDLFDEAKVVVVDCVTALDEHLVSTPRIRRAAAAGKSWLERVGVR